MKIGIHFLPGTLLHKHCQLVFENSDNIHFEEKTSQCTYLHSKSHFVWSNPTEKRQFTICGSEPTILLFVKDSQN